MGSPCTYKVYKRVKGDRKKEMRAQFADLIDAVNYAHAESAGRFNYSNTTLLVINGASGTMMRAYRQGVSV